MGRTRWNYKLVKELFESKGYILISEDYKDTKIKLYSGMLGKLNNTQIILVKNAKSKDIIMVKIKEDIIF